MFVTQEGAFFVLGVLGVLMLVQTLSLAVGFYRDWAHPSEPRSSPHKVFWKAHSSRRANHVHS